MNSEIPRNLLVRLTAAYSVAGLTDSTLLRTFISNFVELQTSKDRKGRLEVLDVFTKFNTSLGELLPSEIYCKQMMVFIAEMGEGDESCRELFKKNLVELTGENTGINYIEEAEKAGVRWVSEISNK